jgi:hypothetical protein
VNSNTLNPNRNQALAYLAQALYDYHNQHITRQPELAATLSDVARRHNEKVMNAIDYLSVRITDHVVSDGGNPLGAYKASEQRLAEAIMEFHAFVVNEWIVWTEEIESAKASGRAWR